MIAPTEFRNPIRRAVQGMQKVTGRYMRLTQLLSQLTLLMDTLNSFAAEARTEELLLSLPHDEVEAGGPWSTHYRWI